MTNTSEPGGTPGAPPQPVIPATPKRGAFPTPQSDIDKAKPYVPAKDDEDDPEGDSSPSTGGDSEPDD